jgi:hypothetical protein
MAEENKNTESPEQNLRQETLKEQSQRVLAEFNDIKQQLIDVRKKEFEEFQNKIHALQQEYGFSIETQYTTRHDGIITDYYFVDLKKILNA